MRGIVGIELGPSLGEQPDGDGHDPVLACTDPAHRQGDAGARQLLQRLASAHRRAGELRGDLHRGSPAEGHDGARGRDRSRRRVHLRVLRRQHRPERQDREPEEHHPLAGIQLERLLPGVAADRVARGQGHRVPRPHRQPVGDLQQEAVRRGRRPRSVPQLDLGPVPRRREEADQSGPAHLRRELPHRRGPARHVLAVLPGPLAARRADPLAGPQEGAVQLAGGRSEPDALAADGDRRPFGVPGPDGRARPNRCSRAGIWRCSSAARGRSRCSTRRRSTGRTCRCRP